MTDRKGKKIKKVVKEFESGKLHSGSKTGSKVTDKSQHSPLDTVKQRKVRNEIC